MIGFAVVGVCAGVVSGVMLRVAALARDRLRRRVPSIPLRFALGGACVGILGVLSPTMFGVGYETTSLLLRGGGSLLFDSEAFGAKALGFFVAASAGLLGGTFAPSLFIGASLGGLVGHAAQLVDAHVDPGAYALVGMGAYFAGTLRAPIAAVLIVLELTNDYGLVVPLMLGVALSNLISHAITPRTLEEDQLVREGFREPPPTRDPLAALLVEEVMSAAPVVFTRETTLLEVIERTRYGRHRIYPIVDERHRLVGQLTGDRVVEAVRGEQVDVTAGELMEPALVAARTVETVHDLFVRMHATGVHRCPVVDAAGVVVGFVSPSDLVRARLRRQAEAGDETLR
jgi:CIC family chloride channel protein